MEKTAFTKETSESLYAYKALAIMLVVTAHCPSGTNLFADRILNFWGTLGVPIFFIVSGFTFKAKEDRKIFWNKKLKSIIIPWVFWGSITYFCHILSDGIAFHLVSAVQWILGTGTWLYFIPVLIVCFAAFRVVKKPAGIAFVILLSYFSNAFVFFDIINCQAIITNYQNPLNWMIFFGIGMLLQNYDINKITKIHAKNKLIIWIGALLTAAAYIGFLNPNYWTVCSIPIELLWAFSIFSIIEFFSKFGIIINIGKLTYPIYFIHMQFGIFAVNCLLLLLGKIELLEGLESSILVILCKPIAVVVVTYLMICILRRIMKLVGLNRFLWVMGIKTE